VTGRASRALIPTIAFPAAQVKRDTTNTPGLSAVLSIVALAPSLVTGSPLSRPD
jgi:hypothetical protein